MFVRLERSDLLCLVRAMAVLMVLVVFGVAAAEHQVNSLTLRNEYVQSFNIRRDQGIYSFYVLGAGEKVNALLPIGSLRTPPNELILKSGSVELAVPTVVHVDTSRAIYWLKLWRKQFVDEAMVTKDNLAMYARHIIPYIERGISAIISQLR